MALNMKEQIEGAAAVVTQMAGFSADKMLFDLCSVENAIKFDGGNGRGFFRCG